MARKKTTKKPKDEWNTFGLRVFDYNVDLDWGFNSAIHDKNRRSDESPVYESHQRLYLDCIVIWPEEQEGDVYHITLTEPIKDWFLGPPTDFRIKLGEFAVKDKHGNRKYRNYKGSEIEIYEPPFEIGSIDKGGGEFHAYIWTETKILAQMINLVLSQNTIYAHIGEVIKPKLPGTGRGKNRWINRISIHLGDKDEHDMETKAQENNAFIFR